MHSEELRRLKILDEEIDRVNDEFYKLADRMVVRLVQEKGIKNDDDNGYFFEDLGDMCCMRTTYPTNDEVSGSDGSEFEQNAERIETCGDDGEYTRALIVTEVGEFDLEDFERDDIIDLIEYLESYEAKK